MKRRKTKRRDAEQDFRKAVAGCRIKSCSFATIQGVSLARQ
jgi:hypothetical protein